MADTFKVLGQSAPAAAALTALYTVPGVTSSTVSSVVVCNTSSAKTKFRISVAVAGAADAIAQYLYYDVPINGNDSFVATIGATLATTDVVRVYSLSGTVSFNAFGVEVT